MTWQFTVLLFIASCGALSWLSSHMIKDVVQVARYLRWREFIIAFFIMSFATSLPNLFTDFNAVLQGKPELAFGDIIGGNLIDLTLILALAVFFSKKGISAESTMVQKSAAYTTAIAILPLLLAFDGNLDRADGLILIISFFLYAVWIFSERDHFKKRYAHHGKAPLEGFSGFTTSIVKIVVILGLLLAASSVVVTSAQFFATALGIPLALVGVLIVGLGNSFPELYFAIVSARRNENWLVLGDLMGSVIVCSTLVLGLVALAQPFEINNFAPFVGARVFLIIAAMLSLFFIRSNRKITKREGLMLLSLYITFLLFEIFVRRGG